MKEYSKNSANKKLMSGIEEFNNMLDEASNWRERNHWASKIEKIEKWDAGINVEKVEEYRKWGRIFTNEK